ncbi:MAG: hypothetical protein ACK5IM_05975 [Demequina sp.]|uniref:hypothetical protein n=1 Tax=Demequina sp. TaxID=2050685 RepID=UPI003A8763C9
MSQTGIGGRGSVPSSTTVSDDNSAWVAARSPYRAVHLASVALSLVLLLGTPLMALGGQPWVMPLLVSVPIVSGTVLTGVVIHALRHTSVPRALVVFVTAAIVGAAAGLVMFPPWNFAWLGLLWCVPVALIAAALGLGMSAMIARSRGMKYAATIVGSAWIVLCLVMSVMLYR